MARKGQGISINVIVIAAIALLVLVILSVLVIRAQLNVTKGTECGGATSAGGRCTPSYNSCSEMYGDGYVSDASIPCPTRNGEKQICCVNRG